MKAEPSDKTVDKKAKESKDIIPEAFQKEFQVMCGKANKACLSYMRGYISDREVEMTKDNYTSSEMPMD